jgi:hypothetical protein
VLSGEDQALNRGHHVTAWGLREPGPAGETGVRPGLPVAPFDDAPEIIRARLLTRQQCPGHSLGVDAASLDRSRAPATARPALHPGARPGSGG